MSERPTEMSPQFERISQAGVTYESKTDLLVLMYVSLPLATVNAYIRTKSENQSLIEL